jgi:hypothetical protein
MRFASDQSILCSPVADFTVELERLTIGPQPAAKAVQDDDQGAYAQTAATGQAELREAMGQVATNAAIQAYVKVRRALAAAARKRAADRQKGLADDAAAAAKAADLRVPGGLPGEFTDYLAGAIDYHRGDLDAARGHWRALLRRPATERRYRSVWAAYMLGRSLVDADPGAAVGWFERTRKLAGGRFADSLGLAAASWGWQGRAELNRKRYRAALACYLAQHRTADRTAAPSIGRAVRAALRDPNADLPALAADDLARRLITAYLISHHPDHRRGRDRAGDYRRWLAALERAQLGDVAGAERLAWTAYTAGDLDAARRWLARADGNEPMTLWLKAKLLMRDGRLDAAAPLLSRAAGAFPARQTWKTRWPGRGLGGWQRLVPAAEATGELGALKLARGQYTQSLDALLRSGAYWRDAAYIAERVLTVDELKAYVDRLKIESTMLDGAGDATKGNPGDPRPRLGQLLARRLTRLGRWREARAYFSPSMQTILDTYINAIRRGHDKTLCDARRADAFWQAAMTVRAHGLSLLGMELGYDIARSARPKWQYQRTDRWRHEVSAHRPADRRFGPTPDETQRAARHADKPRRMFHHGYEAADHAWSACRLMPDQDPVTAQRLAIAGTWLKYADPQYADRFYKALVTRCSQTPLGAEAADRGWFPKIDNAHPVK